MAAVEQAVVLFIFKGRREVKKIYQALAHGRVKPVEGEINVPVGRLPWNKKQFGIFEIGNFNPLFEHSHHSVLLFQR